MAEPSSQFPRSALGDHIRSSLGENKSSTVTPSYLAAVLGYVGDVIALTITDYTGKIRELSTRLDELQKLAARVDALERHGIKYLGTWQRAVDYQRGMVVTHKGSAWIVVRDSTTEEPGTSDAWQLMVKRGRDAT